MKQITETVLFLISSMRFSFKSRGTCSVYMVAIAVIVGTLALSSSAQTIRSVQILGPTLGNANSGQVAVVNSTGLVYSSGQSIFGNAIGVIDSNTNSLIKAIRPANFAAFSTSLIRANQSTNIVYFLASGQIVVVDGRSGSPTFNQLLSPIVFANQTLVSFAIDQTRNRLYATTQIVGSNPVQSQVQIVDINPASGTFHQILSTVALPSGQAIGPVAVNTATNTIYVGITGAGGGVSFFDGVQQVVSFIANTQPGGPIVVNEVSNTIYAGRSANFLTAIDGSTNTLTTNIALPSTLTGPLGRNIAVNSTTERIYAVLTNGSLAVIDSRRTSPTFNTSLANVPGLAGNAGRVAVDDAVNKIVVTSGNTFTTSIIDGATNSITATTQGNLNSLDVAINPNTHRAFIGCSLYTTQAINLNDNSVVNIATSSEIADGVVNPANDSFYIGYSSAGSGIAKLDQNDNLGFLVGVPHSLGRPLFSARNSVTNRAYIVNSAANALGTDRTPGFVSVVDGSTNNVIANVAVGGQPFATPAINESTNKIYVQNAGLGSFPTSMSVIDGATNTSSTVNTSAFAGVTFGGGMAANSATNRIYFFPGQGSTITGVINGATDVATALSGISGTPSLVQVNPTLNRVYFLTTTGLHVLNGANDTEIANIASPSFSTFLINQTTGRIFAVNSVNETLTSINGNTNSVISTVSLVNSGPLAIDESRNLLFIANVTDPNDESTSSISFVDGNSLAVLSVLPIPLRPGRLRVNPVTKKLYANPVNAAQRNGIVVIDYNVLTGCAAIPVSYGQAFNGTLASDSCVVGSDKADLYTFTGTASQQVAISMETSQFFSKIELLNPAGTVIQMAGGDDSLNNSRLPATGYFTLPVSGTYTIRAIAAFGGSGSYNISLFEAPVQNCTYSLSPLRTDVGSAGGSFFFDVITQPGCPPASQPASSGTIYDSLTYNGGRVSFSVLANTGAARTDTITVAGQTHTINQFGAAPPTNDLFASAEVIAGVNSPPGNPTRGSNANASAQNGEQAHAGNPAIRSVWYAWTTPALSSGLYSFSTSGSSFDTVMAIYACPGSFERM